MKIKCPVCKKLIIGNANDAQTHFKSEHATFSNYKIIKKFYMDIIQAEEEFDRKKTHRFSDIGIDPVAGKKDELYEKELTRLRNIVKAAELNYKPYSNEKPINGKYSAARNIALWDLEEAESKLRRHNNMTSSMYYVSIK